MTEAFAISCELPADWRSDRPLLIRRHRQPYRHVLIATDHDDGRELRPAHELLAADADVTLLGAYAVPYHNLHASFGWRHLLCALELGTREQLASFARTSGLPAATQRAIHGAPRDHVRRQLRTGTFDLLVIACGAGMLDRYLWRRLIAQVLEGTTCDVLALCGSRRPFLAWRSEPVMMGI